MVQAPQYGIDPQPDFGYGQLFAIFWRRRFWFAGVFGAVMAVAVPLALLKDSVYRSTMQLLVEPNYQDKQAGVEDEFTDTGVEIDYATQLNLMRSSGLIQRAVNELSSTYPTLTVEDVRESLSLNQVVEQESEVATKIFQASYMGADPQQTQDVLQAMQAVYLEYNLQQQEQRLSKGLQFLDGQLPTAREDLVGAEEALKEFRTTNSAIAPAQEAAELTEDLRSLEIQREILQAEIKAAEARYQGLQGQVGQSPQEALTSSRLSQSARYQTLLNQLQQAELAIAARSVQLTDANPIMQDLLEQRDSLRQLLRQEVERVLGSVPPQLDGSNLQQQGQLGGTDLNLAAALVQAQTDLESLQARERRLAETEAKLRESLEWFPDLIAQYNSLQQKVDVRRNTLQQLLVAQQQLGIELAQGGFNWQVVEPPRLGAKVGPNTRQDLMLGGVVAVFLGGVAAFVREAADDAVRTSDQIQGQVALPLLGVTPKLPEPEMGRFRVNLSWGGDASSLLEIVQWLPFRESLDLIYKNIELASATVLTHGNEVRPPSPPILGGTNSESSSVEGNQLFPPQFWGGLGRGRGFRAQERNQNALRSLAVTSALSGEGKTTIAVGLALSAARLRKWVLLIDADLRQPSLHEQLDLPNEEGLSTVLAGGEPQPHHLTLMGSEIDVLTAGPVPADPVQLLSSGRMTDLLTAFGDYDLIVVDTPPALGIVDAIQVASCCTGTVVVGRLDRVTQSELSEVSVRLSRLNAIGIVANGARETVHRYPALENGHAAAYRQTASR